MRRRNLILFRADKNLSKAGLGRLLDVTGQYIGMIEQCKATGSKLFWRSLKSQFNLTDEEILELQEMEK